MDDKICNVLAKKKIMFTETGKKTLNMYLPLASVKSLIPPPTVSGTKTFSDVYLNTYKASKVI